MLKQARLLAWNSCRQCADLAVGVALDPAHRLALASGENAEEKNERALPLKPGQRCASHAAEIPPSGVCFHRVPGSMANQNSLMANCINVDVLFSTLFPQIVPRGTFDWNRAKLISRSGSSSPNPVFRAKIELVFPSSKLLV